MPLVLAFHGFKGNGPWMEYYTGLSKVADQASFAVAYPNALGKQPSWNITGPAGRYPDDVAFGRDLITELEVLSQEIADKCELKIDLKQRYFPVFTTPDKKTPAIKRFSGK